MLKLAVLAACAACALAQTGATADSSAINAVCDEPRTYDILRANAKGVTCDGVQYDPRKYRCCGKTLRRLPAATTPFSKPSSQDANIGGESDSQFCYGKEHVSSRQLVCGGEIVSSGTWDAFGRRLTEVACCVGTTYTKTETAYENSDGTGGIASVKRNDCCQGTVTDLKPDADTNAATLGCCGAASYDLAKQVCCGGTVFDEDNANKQCCGSTYVDKDAKKTCCNGVMESSADDDGNILGFCCNGRSTFNVKAETWNLLADVMTKATAPAKDSTDAVWTINKVCGCKNELVDVSKGWIAGQEFTDQPIFTNEFTCAGGKDDKSPCAAATGGKTAIEGALGCCGGEQFYTANSVCVNMFKEADAITKSKGEEVSETGPDYKSGSHLRKNFVNGNYMFMPVSETFSKNFYNTQTDLVDVYCGKSSAATAVASVLAACLAFLAL